MDTYLPERRTYTCPYCGAGISATSPEQATYFHRSDDCPGPRKPALTAPSPSDEAGRCRICGGVGGEHDGAVHDARGADMPALTAPSEEADRG